VTDSYPGPGEYLIHLVEGDTGTPTRTLIFGRDGAGARNGVEQWVRFLRSERRGAVREARP